MHYDHPKNLRRLIRHRCQYCGRDFFTDKHAGRPRLFCDKKCKDGEFRRLRYLTFKNVETPQKSEVSSRISKVDSGDRPPIEILGRGHRWNDAASIDRGLVAAIIEIEIGGGRFHSSRRPTKHTNKLPHQPDSNRPANPYLDEIPADLSMPTFLRRGQS